MQTCHTTNVLRVRLACVLTSGLRGMYQVAGVVEQLGGGALVENRHTSNNAARWPSAGAIGNSLTGWVSPAEGHIDGYGPGGWNSHRQSCHRSQLGASFHARCPWTVRRVF